MAFSKGDGLGPYIGVIAIVVVAVMLVSLGRTNSRWNMVAIGLVVGGAIGNILDRLFRGEGWFRGAVVDFIDPQWFPIFNVADIARDGRWLHARHRTPGRIARTRRRPSP